MTALAIRRRGILAPRISCDPDAVLQILVSQRSWPGLHVDEPGLPVCTSSHRLPLQHSPLFGDGRKGGRGRGCRTGINLLQWLAGFSSQSFKLLTKLQPHLSHYCLVSPPHTLLLLSPKIAVNFASCFISCILASPRLITSLSQVIADALLYVLIAVVLWNVASRLQNSS